MRHTSVIDSWPATDKVASPGATPVNPTRRCFVRRVAAVFAALMLQGSLHTPIIAAGSLPAFAIPRDAWNDRPPRPGMRPHQIDRITLHHTGPPAWYGAPPAPAYLHAIQAFHMGPERRWPDIAYHLLVDLDGAVWEGRSLTVAGDTATDYDPSGHALIAVLGDYSVQQPNAAQWDAIVGTVRWLMDTYGVAADTLFGHRDYAATACPGDSLAILLDEIRHQVAG